jgi:hypothetical protein
MRGVGIGDGEVGNSTQPILRVCDIEQDSKKDECIIIGSDRSGEKVK